MLWVFFAKPVSLKTVRGAEDSAVANVPGETSHLAADCHVGPDMHAFWLQRCGARLCTAQPVYGQVPCLLLPF